MTASEVLSLLESNANPRGIESWAKMGNPKLTSFGLGLTQLKKLAKQVPNNTDLAAELWATDNWDAKQLALLVNEPKKLSVETLDQLAAEVGHWMLGHVFLQNVMAKSPHLQDRFETWKASKDDGLRSLGWGCLGYLGKSKKMADDFFPPHVAYIEGHLQSEANFVRDSMNTALFTIGQRSKALHAQCLATAQSIGPVTVDYGDNSCQALDVVKHLSGPRISSKFA